MGDRAGDSVISSEASVTVGRGGPEGLGFLEPAGDARALWGGLERFSLEGEALLSRTSNVALLFDSSSDSPPAVNRTRGLSLGGLDLPRPPAAGLSPLDVGTLDSLLRSRELLSWPTWAYG